MQIFWNTNNGGKNIIPEIELPEEYSITNFPNPFNPSTKIYYAIPKEGNVRITVYNSVGQRVIDLVNEFKQSGVYNVKFDGSNFASGIYYYKIQSGNFSHANKMLLIK